MEQQEAGPSPGAMSGPDEPQTMQAPPANAVEPRGFYAAQAHLRRLLEGLERGELGITVDRVLSVITYKGADGVDTATETGGEVVTLVVRNPSKLARCVNRVGGAKVLGPGPRPSFLAPEAS